MKQSVLFFIFSLFIVFQLTAQKEYPTHYEVQYNLRYSPDSLHLAKKDSTTLYLYTSKTTGVFMNGAKALEKEDNEKQREKLSKKYGAEAAKNMTFHMNFGWEGVINKIFYKDLQAKRVKAVGVLAGKVFVFSKPKSFSPWQIEDETKQVGDYTAQKATTSFAGRDYVAWFTLEIPIPDGPYVFSGLPGLIVELYDTRDDYHFTLKSIYKLKKPNIWKIPKDAKAVSKSRFEKLKKTAKKNQRSASEVIDQSIKEAISSKGLVMGNTNNVSSTYKVKGKTVSKAEFNRMVKSAVEKTSLKVFNNPIELK